MLISITRKLDDAKKERKGKLVKSAYFYALLRTAPLRDNSKNDSVQRRLWYNLSRSLKETKEIFNNLRLVNLKTLKTVPFSVFWISDATPREIIEDWWDKPLHRIVQFKNYLGSELR